MIFTAENTLLIGSILLFVSIVVGKTGYRFGVPTLLLFLVVGMLFGSDGLGLQFHDAKDGYEVQRNQTHFRTRYRAFYRRSFTHCPFHRIVYLVAIRHELDKYLSAYHDFIVIGSYYVVYRLGLRIRYPAFAENESET